MNQPTENQIELLDALKAMLEMFEAICDKVDWGKSFLNARTIRLFNEAPLKARKAIADYEQLLSSTDTNSNQPST
ncbi:MAG TPA: hypothetical protein VN256_12860 [Pyrinomonadaceae bacterium]|nr:hypothetical protein [Pyrinomonadaceae bacterium]